MLSRGNKVSSSTDKSEVLTGANKSDMKEGSIASGPGCISIDPNDGPDSLPPTGNSNQSNVNTSNISGPHEKITSYGHVVVGGGHTGIGANRSSVTSGKSTASVAHSKGKALLAAVVTKTGLRGVKRDTLGSEPVFIETQERQHEETVVTLNIGKIHSQLRRLRNESTILKDAVITAIPEHFSKVLFTCARTTTPLRSIDHHLHFYDNVSANA